MTDTLTDNGLPVEAQPWARGVERFIRDYETEHEMLARNGERAMVAAGTAVTAAANSAATQAAAIAQMRRVPEKLDASKVTLTPSAYFDASGTPHGRIDVSIIPSDLDVDGNPLIPTAYQVWGRVFWADATLPDTDHSTIGNGPGYQFLGTSPTTHVQVDGLQVGVKYQLRVTAVSAFGVSAALSDYITATTPATLEAMTVPSAPQLLSGAGEVAVKWDGLFGAAQPPSQFRYVYVQMSPAGAGTWTRAGSPLLRGGGTIQLGGLVVGSAYDFEFVAVDSLGNETAPSAVSTITVAGIDQTSLAPDLITLIDSSSGTTITMSTDEPIADGTAVGDIWFQRDANSALIAQWMWDGASWTKQTISHEVIASIDLGTATVGELDGGFIKAKTLAGEKIVAGSISVNELSPTIGDDLGLAAKGSVDIVAGQVADLTADQQATADSLAVTQTRFSVKPDGAYVSSPGAVTQLALRNDGVQILENGQVVSSWNSGQMIVDSFVGDEVIMGAHKIAKNDPTSTVVKAL